MPVNRAPYRRMIILDRILQLLADPVADEPAEDVSEPSDVLRAGEVHGDSTGFIDVGSADEIPEEDLAEMEEVVAEIVSLNVELRGLDAEEKERAETHVRNLVFKCWRLGRRFPPPMDLGSDAWRELSDDVDRA